MRRLLLLVRRGNVTAEGHGLDAAAAGTSVRDVRVHACAVCAFRSTWACVPEHLGAESERSDDRSGQVVVDGGVSVGASPFFLRMDCPRSVRT